MPSTVSSTEVYTTATTADPGTATTQITQEIGPGSKDGKS